MDISMSWKEQKFVQEDKTRVSYIQDSVNIMIPKSDFS